MAQLKCILITVGTTQFDELINTIDSDLFINMLIQIGFDPRIADKKLIYQIGAQGCYLPKHGTYFRLSPQISSIYAQADLLICHGGAGTLLEALSMKKPIISVVNNKLANNHQIQLVEKLTNQNSILGFKSIQQFKICIKTTIAKFILNISNNHSEKYQQKFQNKCLLNKLVFQQEQ